MRWLSDEAVQRAIADQKIQRRIEKVWFTRKDVAQTETVAAYTILIGHLGDKLIRKVIPNVVLVMSALGPAFVVKEQEDAIRNEFARALRDGAIR